MTSRSRFTAILAAGTIAACAHAANTHTGLPVSPVPGAKYSFVGNAAGYGMIYGFVTFLDGSAKLSTGGRTCEMRPAVTTAFIAMDCEGVRITFDRVNDSVTTTGRAWIEKKYSYEVPNNNVALSCESVAAQSLSFAARSFPSARDCLQPGQIAELHARTYTGAVRVTRVDSSAAAPR